jgi:hypothetical protein
MAVPDEKAVNQRVRPMYALLRGKRDRRGAVGNTRKSKQPTNRSVLGLAVAILLALAVLALWGLSKGRAMGVFDRLVLFSEVRGTVLKAGTPVEGAELVQKVVWSDDADKNPTQQTVTDKEGAFSFPAIERKAGLLRLIPAQPTIQQTLVIRYQGVEYGTARPPTARIRNSRVALFIWFAS